MLEIANELQFLLDFLNPLGVEITNNELFRQLPWYSYKEVKNHI